MHNNRKFGGTDGVHSIPKFGDLPPVPRNRRQCLLVFKIYQQCDFMTGKVTPVFNHILVRPLDGRLVCRVCRSVAEGLKTGITVKPQLFVEASVSFVVIHNFTVIVSKMTPVQTVDLINHLWITFDDVASKHNVYKVAHAQVSFCVHPKCYTAILLLMRRNWTARHVAYRIV